MLDILGYTSLIENNDVGENTGKILEMMNNHPKDLVQQIVEQLNTARDAAERIVKEDCSFLIFSDTILFTMEIRDDLPDNEKAIRWGIATLYLSKLFKNFLDNGFPLRGGVSFGEYSTQDFCFAGKPIINAYKEAADLDCAGIIVDGYAAAELLNIAAKDDKYKDCLCVNPVIYQSKSEGKKENYFITIFLPYTDDERLVLQNERELSIYLTKSFTAHNKGLPAGAKVKLDHTIDLFKGVFEKINE